MIGTVYWDDCTFLALQNKEKETTACIHTNYLTRTVPIFIVEQMRVECQRCTVFMCVYLLDALVQQNIYNCN